MDRGTNNPPKDDAKVGAAAGCDLLIMTLYLKIEDRSLRQLLPGFSAG